jgi:hypothetical protein
MLNITWAITMVVKPVLMPTDRNRDRSDAPRTISGVPSGRKMKKLSGPRPRNW